MGNNKEQFTDAFDVPIRKNTSVDIEVASHYEYNAERWRLFVDGSRQFPEYGSVSQYNHDGHNHELKPASGETVTLETTERPRYTVQFELAATWAFSINQSLNSGDKIKIGLYDGSDGWYLEQDGTHNDDQADLVIENSGTEQLRRENVDIIEPSTTFARLALRTGWYDITRQEWGRSFPHADDGGQENEVIARTGLPDKIGPQIGNLPLHFEVQASSSTSNLQLNAGSCALVTYGDSSEQVRQKEHEVIATISSTNTYVPFYALRLDPDRSLVNTQLINVIIKQFGGSGDAKFLAIACDPSKTDANFDDPDDDGTNEGTRPPEEHSSQNSVLQETFSVSEFPDSSGTQTTSASNPGGYQLGYSSLYTGGGSTINNAPSNKQRKRIISGKDNVIFLANVGATGDITIEVTTEQDF